MKMKMTALVMLVVASAMMAAVKPLSPSQWYAVEAGQVGLYSWIPQDPNFEFDYTKSVLPEGFNIERVVDPNGVVSVLTQLDSGPVGVSQATIVVHRHQDIGGSWTGPKIDREEVLMVEVIRYSSTIVPFLSGQPTHVILPVSVQQP